MKRLFTKRIYIVILVCSCLALLIKCKKNDIIIDPVENDMGDYTLVSKFDSIRSYPLGGGNFVLYIQPDASFKGEVKFSIEADPKLNATLNKTTLTSKNNVIELTINPVASVDIKDYPITVKATHNNIEKKKYLNVKLYQWLPGNTEASDLKLNDFKSWLIAQNPKYASLFQYQMQKYLTYPEILIVEHWTYLSNDYELRFCFHVMIPPHDWSRIQIRQRGRVEAELSALRVTDGTISIIPNSDYPILSGY